MKRIIINTLKVLFFLSIGFFFIWLFVKDFSAEDKRNIFDSFLNANYFWVGVSLLVGLLSHVFRAMRWRLLFEPMGYTPRILNTFSSVMVAYFANLALPRLGEIVRCSILKKHENIPFANSLGTVIAERAFDMLTFIVLFVINILIQFQQIKAYIYNKIYCPITEKLNFNNFNLLLITLVVIIILVILLFYYFHKKHSENKVFLKIKDLFIGFWNGIKSISQVKKPFMFFLYTFLLWLSYFATLYFCTLAMSETSSLSLFAPFSVLIFGSIGIMLVQGGIGIYPAITAEVLILYNIAVIDGYAFGWLAWSAQTFAIIILGVVALILLPLINKKNKKECNT